MHRILNTALEIIRTEGMHRLTTNRIVERSTVNIASVYHYFPNKHAIVAGIAERGMLEAEDLLRVFFDANADKSIDEIVRMSLMGLIGFLEQYRPVIQEIFSATPLLGDSSVPSVIEPKMMSFLATYIARNPNRYEVRGGTAAMYVAVNSAIFMFLKWIVDEPTFVTREEFIDAFVAHVTSPVQSV